MIYLAGILEQGVPLTPKIFKRAMAPKPYLHQATVFPNRQYVNMQCGKLVNCKCILILLSRYLFYYYLMIYKSCSDE